MPVPSFPLTTSGWIPVWDQDTRTARDVGLTEALTRAHRLAMFTGNSDQLPLLRVLAAAFDAACGPRDTAEWDAAWRADALDADRITAYLDQWADRLDLLHPEHPAFQCGALTNANRGLEALHPGSLGGAAGRWFNHALSAGDLPPCAAGEAARRLLYLITYDVAGIKGAAPGDPAERGSKIYGSKVGPMADATHVHLQLPGARLKDLLLLNLPPQPRTPGDAPVWERQTPPAPVRTREVTGRLDLLTWPNRRIRLFATDQGMVNALAVHDGDRTSAPSWDVARRLDPMTAWRVRDKGDIPMTILSAESWPQPWRGVLLLDQDAEYPHTSQAVQHAVAAAQRGVLAPATPINAVTSVTVHSNRHQAVLSDIPVVTMPLGTAAQLARDETRSVLAKMAGYAGAIERNLRAHAKAVSGRSAEQVNSRMVLSDLDHEWAEAVALTGHDLDAGRAAWRKAVRAAADHKIDTFPMSVMDRAKLRSVYEDPPTEQAMVKKTASRATSAGPGGPTKRRRGRPTTKHEAFAGSYSLSEIAALPQCVVTYKTLASRVAQGWGVEEAATTPGRRRRPSSIESQD
ncbi:type I-E CRISPR-associated protein Cse1/CasA [Streptomyces botrytidirepellens]|nr:type I-E CRISPR-associated protein Cse1/CasA [Streptomyces botrytidirepellens]